MHNRGPRVPRLLDLPLQLIKEAAGLRRLLVGDGGAPEPTATPKATPANGAAARPSSDPSGVAPRQRVGRYDAQLVEERPGITVAQAAASIGVHPTALYPIIKRLEARGRISKRGRELHASADGRTLDGSSSGARPATLGNAAPSAGANPDDARSTVDGRVRALLPSRGAATVSSADDSIASEEHELAAKAHLGRRSEADVPEAAGRRKTGAASCPWVLRVIGSPRSGRALAARRRQRAAHPTKAPPESAFIVRQRCFGPVIRGRCERT